jgi:acyl-CoA synthetase (NDP forming)
MTPRITVDRILNPASVAVFGASDDRSKWAGRIMYYLALHGYAGDVIPINPRRQVVQGKTCYPRIADAPHVDVAIIAIPAALVPATLRECADAGVGCCLIISSGFAEVGAEGEALQQEISELSQRTGMRLIGPNCLGLINILTGMALTSARVLEVERLHRGRIGFVTQSGAIMLSVFNRAHDVGIGFSHLVSVGNQADLDLSDFFEHMIDDPATEVICLHVEGLRDGRRFLELIRRARRAGKPVIALKTGRSELGERAARSHTASLAGAYPVFEAACRDAGVVLVDDPDVMVLVANMIQKFGAPAAGAVAMLSPSGGINGIVADRLADAGVPLAVLAPETRDSLRAVMLPTHLDNPVDLGARRQELGETNAVAARAVELVAADPGVNAIVIALTTSPNYEATAKALGAAAVASCKPCFTIITPGSVADGVRAVLREIGCPYGDRIDDGVRMLAAYTRCLPAPATAAAADAASDRAERDSAITSRRSVPASPGSMAASHDPVVAGGALQLRTGYLTEPEAKALLARYGIPVTRERVVRERDEAIAAAEAIGFPVALKAVTDKVVHKSDAGLVELALASADALARAWEEIRRRLATLDPSAESLVVQEMVSGELELILGAKLDPAFGPVVMVGSGGVLVELLRDIQLARAPIDAAAAEALLRGVKAWPLLEGYRGRGRLDVSAVANALSRLSRLAVDLGPRLGDIDINPLIVRADGRGAVAADARAVIASGA